MPEILLVDDETEICELVRDHLEQRGHRVRVAHDANSALSALLDAAPDVLLLDIGLPGVDGWTILERIKADPDPAVSCVRVVLLTGANTDSDRLRGMINGAVQHVPKPFLFPELDVRLDEVLAGEAEPVLRKRTQLAALQTLARLEREVGVSPPSRRLSLRPSEEEARGGTTDLHAVAGLTCRQKQVLQAVSHADSQAAAAATLGISPAAVSARLKGIAKRLDITPTELVTLSRGGRILSGIDEEQATFASELDRAAERNELVLYYQPIVNISDRSLVAAEALLRWDHPTQGLVPPSLFIPVAEETGAVWSLGEWALREACLHAVEWGDGQRPRPLRMMVNLSGAQAGRSELVGIVRAALGESGLDPPRLALEVTETFLMADTDAASRVLGAIRDLGVRVGLDDFGTSYSSLGQLKRLPIDFLKIDASFVAGLGQVAEDTAIVSAILAIAASLGIEVVAEGIETFAQLDMLEMLGCQYGQGFYIAGPTPAGEFPGELAHADGTVWRAGRRPAVRTLLCDDDPRIRAVYRDALEHAGAVVTEAASAQECLAAAERDVPELVVLDVSMPGGGGLEIISRLRALCPSAIIVLVSGVVSVEMLETGRMLGAHDCVTKTVFLPRISGLLARCRQDQPANRGTRCTGS